MSQLIHNLPSWVIALFFTLLWLGYTQTKTRHISRFRITLLPLIFLGLSIYGVLNVPHALPLAVIAWGLGIRGAFRFNSQFDYGRGVVMDQDREHFVVPGSWIPLALMLSVFAIRFVQGYLTGAHVVDPNSISYIVISALVSGLISGTFLARAVAIFRSGSDLTQVAFTSTGA